ncbi:DUF3523 domain-containing protein [archaeon]|nr:MAG: DUF3523 domain-containing protein [archaeon]
MEKKKLEAKEYRETVLEGAYVLRDAAGYGNEYGLHTGTCMVCVFDVLCLVYDLLVVHNMCIQVSNTYVFFVSDNPNMLVNSLNILNSSPTYPGIKLASTTIGEGLRDFITDKQKLANSAAVVTLIAFGVYGARASTGVVGRWVSCLYGVYGTWWVVYGLWCLYGVWCIVYGLVTPSQPTLTPSSSPI